MLQTGPILFFTIVKQKIKFFHMEPLIKGMLGKSVILSLYGALVVHLIISLIWGNQGVAAHNRLREERIIFEDNLEELERENRTSQIQLDQLKNDRVSLTLQARKLGYVKEGEMLILTGIGTSLAGDSYDLPLLITGVQKNYGKNGFIRTLSFLTAMVLFCLIILWDWGRRGIRKPRMDGS